MNKLDKILEHMNYSCSDGNCIFRPSTAKGLVTNGSCRCAGDYTKRHQTERLIRWMKVMVSGTIKTCCKSSILLVKSRLESTMRTGW